MSNQITHGTTYSSSILSQHVQKISQRNYFRFNVHLVTVNLHFINCQQIRRIYLFIMVKYGTEGNQITFTSVQRAFN